MLLSSIHSEASEIWPKPRVEQAWIDHLYESFEGTSGYFHDESYKSYSQNYQTSRDYLNYGQWRAFFDDGEIAMVDGLPKVRLGPTVYDNPVTLAQFALTMYGRHLRGDPEAQGIFRKAIEKLVSIQAADGSFPYPIDLQYREDLLKRGWVSAMAQGQALSAFARALLLDPYNRRVRTAGEKAIRNLVTSIDKGGTTTDLRDLDPSLTAFRFYAEYPVKPQSYTLNGFMFTLLGLYDWSNRSETADRAFHDGMRTLSHILPYYDIGGYSAYDLSHIVKHAKPYAPKDYESAHVYLLHALNSVDPRPATMNYEEKWRATLDRMNALLKITTIKIDKSSPQPSYTTITVDLDTRGGPKDAKKLYRFGFKYGNDWTLSDWSASPVITWTPILPGDYVLGFYARNEGSKAEWDNFRYMPYTVTDELSRCAAC